MSIHEAARQLGVSEQAVRHLAASGEIDALKRGGAWWLDSRAVERRRRQGPAPGRPLSPAMAWAVLLLASGRSELDGVVAHDRQPLRAKRWLAAHSLVEDVGRLRARARPERLAGHESELPRLLERDDTMRTGSSVAEIVGLHGGGDGAEAYAPASHRATIVAQHGLVAGNGSILLRWVPDAIWPALAGDRAPRAAMLVDLLESDDPRARREAARELGR